MLVATPIPVGEAKGERVLEDFDQYCYSQSILLLMHDKW